MTSTFDFLMVLYSIIIGISIAEILTPIGHVIQGNRTVKLYWVHTGWVFLIFFVHVFVWFSAWQYAGIKVWRITDFVMFLTAPVILFISSVVALPKVDPDENYDLREYYFDKYRWLHSLLVTVILLNGASEYFLLGQDPLTIGNMARGIALIVLLVGLPFPKPRWHGFQIVVIYLLIGFFALNYRETIGA